MTGEELYTLVMKRWGKAYDTRITKRYHSPQTHRKDQQGHQQLSVPRIGLPVFCFLFPSSPEHCHMIVSVADPDPAVFYLPHGACDRGEPFRPRPPTPGPGRPTRTT